jgi:hypothetical protein
MKPRANILYRAALAVLICIVCQLALAGGPGTVPSLTAGYLYVPPEPNQPDVGDVYVSVTGIRSLDEVIDDLQPTFQITPQSAFQMAVPDTKNTLESALSAFSGSLGIGITPPSSTPTIPSNAPPAPQTLPGGLTNLLAAPLGMDPVSEYQAAASLYQQVKLLNQSLKDAPRFKNYDAYILTVQVTLMPYQRSAPYDAYADLSFFSGTNEAPTPPASVDESLPLIYPILTSDQLEAASDQQSINNLTSLSLALSAAYHGVGVQAALSQLNQNLNAIVGNNLNSLLTIGKVTQNTVALRLGARNSTTTNGLTMLPEAHTIAFLVMAPHDANELEMISDVTLRDAANGRPLQLDLKNWGKEIQAEFDNKIFGGYLGLSPIQIQGLWEDQCREKQKSQQDSQTNAAVLITNTSTNDASLVTRQGAPGPTNIVTIINGSTNSTTQITISKANGQTNERSTTPGLGGTAEPQPRSWRWSFEQKLMNDVNNPLISSNAFAGFCYDFSNYFYDTNKFNVKYLTNNPDVLAGIQSTIASFNTVNYDSLWQDITKIQVSQYENDLTPLPHWRPKLPPTNQAVLYTDDGQSTTFTLDSGKAVSSAASKISAELTLRSNTPSVTSKILYSDQIQTSGNEIKVTFPAISSMSGTDTNPFELDLILETNDEANLTASYNSFVMVKNKLTPPPPAWSIVRTYGLLIAGPTNVFTIVLANSTNAIATTNYLDIENPQIVSQTNGGVLGKQINEVYTLVVTNNNFATFTFGPLITGQNVNFNLLGPDQKFIATLATAMVYPPNSSQTTSSSTGSGH